MKPIRFTLPIILSLMGCLLLCDVAQAQRQGRRGFRGFGVRPRARFELATLEVVQKELELTDGQKTLASESVDASREERRSLGFGAADELAKFNAELETKFVAKLDEKQQARLNGLMIQANGPSALMDSAIAKALEITEEQTKQLTEVSTANGQAFRDAFRDFQDMTREERQEKFTTLREEGSKSLLAVLTDAQRDKLAELEGEKVEIDLNQLRRGGRGRQGGGGPPRNTL